jgi:hypothetical protein
MALTAINARTNPADPDRARNRVDSARLPRNEAKEDALQSSCGGHLNGRLSSSAAQFPAVRFPSVDAP